MESIQHIIEQIPIRHNSVSYCIFLGIFLGLLLSLVILLRTSKKSNAFRMFGWSLLIQSLIASDVFLCYTGLMKYVPHLNDSTEPLVLLLAPSIYLFVYSLLVRKPITIQKDWIHILPSVAYFLTQLRYYFQPTSIKINAYLGAYYPEKKLIPVPENIDYSYLWIKDEFRWLVLFSFAIYSILSIRLILKNIHYRVPANSKKASVSKYDFSKNTLIGFLAAFILIFLVFLNFEDDGGDHFIFLFHTGIVCVTSFVLLSNSRFFENSWIADKYETTKVKNEKDFIKVIQKYVEQEHYFLSQSASLKDLSQTIKSNPNHISQVINAETGLNFNDFINQYRIEAAKKRLLDQKFDHLTIEAIGNSVGFKSKSTFYSAFKKHTQMSPKEFIQTQKSIHQSL